MGKDLTGELSAADQLFCRNYSKGMNLTEAYSASRNCRSRSKHNIEVAASRLAGKPECKKLIHELLRDARVTDLDSIGKMYADLLGDMASARKDGNHTALAAYSRLRAQIMGAVNERLIVSDERVTTDTALIERLAGGDKVKVAELTKLLGAASDGFGPAKPEPVAQVLPKEGEKPTISMH
jgi:hypothetical protein